LCITYVPTLAGFLCLAIVLDAWSRKIVGWSMANHLRAELVLDAMEMAVGQRRPKDVIHHSDQGSQYTSVAFGKRCGAAGVRPSMGSVGDAYDNAMAESFFSTLEAELLSRRRFASQAEARRACFSYIEGWGQPRQVTLGHGPPFSHGLRSQHANGRSRHVAPKSTNRPQDRDNLTRPPPCPAPPASTQRQSAPRYSSSFASSSPTFRSKSLPENPHNGRANFQV
jgi:hypothetical protein